MDKKLDKTGQKIGQLDKIGQKKNSNFVHF